MGNPVAHLPGADDTDPLYRHARFPPQRCPAA
jgi:hypothetical protein